MTERAALPLIRNIARQNQVQAAVSGSETRLDVTLSVNPKLPAFGFRKGLLKRIKRELEAQGRSAASLDEKLTGDWKEAIMRILAQVGRTLTPEQAENIRGGEREASTQAKRMIRKQVKAEVKKLGVKGFVEKHAKELPPSVAKGRAAEQKALANYARTLKATSLPGVFEDANGRKVVLIPRGVGAEMKEANKTIHDLFAADKESATGFDFAIAILEGGKDEELPNGVAVVGDIKTKLGEQLAEETSSETAEKMASGRFTPDPAKEVKGPLRDFAEQKPEEALKGESFRRGTKEAEDGTDVEVVRRIKNQIKSLTIPETYAKSIQQVIDQLTDAILKVRNVGGDPEGLVAAQELFQRALTESKTVQVERVIRTESEPGIWRTAVEQLLSAGARIVGLAENKFFVGVRQLDKNGDLIGPLSKR